MLAYRPSIGNSSVSLNENGEWTGYSIGGEVIESVRFGPEDYFLKVWASITDNSDWFYKTITDVDVLKSFTYYRAVYIGPDEKTNFPEIIGTLSSSVTNDFVGIPYKKGIADSSIDLELWFEGIFTKQTSKNSILLDGENDPTEQIPSTALFNDTITISTPIPKGAYAKVWIKVTIHENPILRNDRFTYTFSVNDLNIKISKDVSRLSYAEIYANDIDVNEDNIILRSIVPDEFLFRNDIAKIFFLDGLYHIIYIRNKKIKDLIVEPSDDYTENKYVDVDLSEISGDMVPSLVFSEKPSENNILKTITDCALSSEQFDKSVVDIHHTVYEDFTFLYVFYNQLIKTTSESYFQQYGNHKWEWKPGVVFVDIQGFRKEFFETIEPGYVNRQTAFNYIGHDYKMKDDLYIIKAVQQDDLFTVTGFKTSNSTQKTYSTVLNFLWESDVIKQSQNYQTTYVPQGLFNKIRTIENKADTPDVLYITDVSSVQDDLTHERKTYTNALQQQWVDMGPPAGKKLKHIKGTSIVYETEEEIKEWNSTIAIRVGVLTTEVSGVYSTPYNPLNPQHLHLVDSEPVSSVGITPLVPSVCPSGCILPLFTISSPFVDPVASIDYDFEEESFVISTVDQTSGSVLTWVSRQFILGSENVFTFNTERFPVWNSQCKDAEMVRLVIYHNGEEIWKGITYNFNNTETLTVTYCPSGNFEGGVSYWDMRKPVDDISSYARLMHRIHANISWVSLGKEVVSDDESKEVQSFKFKRTLTLQNASPCNDEVIYPIVLLGKSYDLTTYEQEDFSLGDYRDDINWQILRTIISQTDKDTQYFDFGKMNMNDKSFHFSILETGETLDWWSDDYDVVNDRLVVWVKLKNYTQQKIVMHYGNQSIDAVTSPSPFKDFYGVWVMNRYVDSIRRKYIVSKIFEHGETTLYLKTHNNKYLLEIQHPYFVGEKKVYKSNVFDVVFDDRKLDNQQTEVIKDFIWSVRDIYSPANKILRRVDSMYNYITETENREKETNE